MYSKLLCAGLVAINTVNGAHVLVRRDGAHGHSHGGQADAGSGYAAPAPAAPASSYGAPAADYGAPAASYDAPSDGYGVQDASGYGASGYGAEEEAFPISTLIIPILIIAGLSLLFPTITTVSVRKRRSADADVNPMTDVVERVNDIYSSVVASEECMERIACEVGGLAADVGLTQSPALKLASGFVPSKYKSYYKQFQSGKDCHKIKCGTFA